MDSASERTRLGLDRARASRKLVGRTPALTHEQTGQCQRMSDEDAGMRRIALVMGCSPATVREVLSLGGE